MARRTSAHIKVQRDGKVRDFRTCQVCGSREKVEGHHIIDYQFAGATTLENIISLCHKCHTKVHQGKISLFKF